MKPAVINGGGAKKERNMTWLTVILFLAAGILAYVLVTRQKKAKAPEAFYVCDICGEHHCDCHKAEPGQKDKQQK
jgi:hypothetical protein